MCAFGQRSSSLGALLLLAVLAIFLATCAAAANVTHAPNGTVTKAPVPAPKMTWKAWVTLATCFVVLIVLMTRLITCLAAMILSSTFLYLCGIITLKDMLAGLSNNGVVTIALLFICVDPIADLPLVKKLVGKCLGGKSGNPALARLKIVALCLLTSSFLNNAPQVAVLTNLIKNHCREHGLFPSQFLMPMDFATLIGNYAVIGTSTNLIVSGLMQKANLGSMSFFELVKVNGPFFPVVMLYLIFAPYLLLPADKGGLFRVTKDVQLAFITRLRVDHGSRIIGSALSKLHSYLPEEKSDIRVVEVERDGRVLPEAPPEMKVEEGDVLTVAGSPALLRASAHILGLSWLPANILKECPAEKDGEEREMQNRSGGEDLNLVSNPNVEVSQPPVGAARRGTPSATSLPYGPGITPTVTPRDRALQPPSTNDILHRSFGSLGAAASHTRVLYECHTTLFEAVLSSRCPHIGQSVASGVFQNHYNVSIIAARLTSDAQDIWGDALPSYTFQAGDVLLLLARNDFKLTHHDGGDFIVINTCEEEEDDFEEHYLQVPAWFPFGHVPARGNARLKGKVIPIPLWYPYLVIPVFLAMIACAIAEVGELVVCALIACIALVTLGVTSLDRAIQSIDVPLFIMVAFSFGLGAAMDASGFSKFLGYQVQEAELTGLPLLYVVALISGVMGNLITDKAAVQVVVPLVIAMYKAQGLNPLGGIMCCLCISTQALCTPYGFSTNLMIMGPGGYVPSDFVKFGLPLNLLGVAIIPLICYGVYYT